MARQLGARSGLTGVGCAGCLGLVLMIFLTVSGCARLPYTTQVTHDDGYSRVTLQREVSGTVHTHPVELSVNDLQAVLRGFSVRESQRLPLRWFAEEMPSRPLFREQEWMALAGPLAEALAKAQPNERVGFELRAPGKNPAAEWDTTAGWIAVQHELLQLEMDYVHVLTPRHRSDPYDTNYPTPREAPRDYLLYFEPGRFWGRQPGFDEPVLQYRRFLQTAPREIGK